jgi:hypothetical protein
VVKEEIILSIKFVKKSFEKTVTAVTKVFKL